MVIDTSAIIAILFDEPERMQFIELIESAEVKFLSAAGLLEPPSWWRDESGNRVWRNWISSSGGPGCGYFR